MTPEQYRQLQNRINRQVAVQSLALLRVATPTSDAQWARLAALLFAVVKPQRTVSHALGLAYYAAAMPSNAAPPVDEPEYLVAMTAKAIERFRPRWDEASTSGRLPMATQGTAAMVRHVEQAGRETVVQAARMDGARFARMDPQPPCCSFCTLLISRGPVYVTAETGGFLAHDFDTCVAVPVPRGATTWPGKAQYEAAEKFYVKHAAGAKPGDQLTALRKAVGEQGSPI